MPEGQVVSVFEHLSQDSALLHTLHLRLITMGKIIIIKNLTSVTLTNYFVFNWKEFRQYFLEQAQTCLDDTA